VLERERERETCVREKERESGDMCYIGRLCDMEDSEITWSEKLKDKQ